MNDDLISRQAVLGLAYDLSKIDGELFSEPCMVVDVEDIQKLPPVNPIRPRGHWIEGKYKDTDIRYNETSYKCSRCGEIVDFEKPTCPNCTADMSEEQE